MTSFGLCKVFHYKYNTTGHNFTGHYYVLQKHILPVSLDCPFLIALRYSLTFIDIALICSLGVQPLRRCSPCVVIDDSIKRLAENTGCTYVTVLACKIQLRTVLMSNNYNCHEWVFLTHCK